jgi:hypothetical protein
LGSLPNEIPLKLRQGAKDMEDELSATGRGVDLLGEALKCNSALI